MNLSPEEGAVFGRLADHPDSLTRFTPASPTRPDYQVFNADVVWPLEQLKRRGLVVITDRIAARTANADSYWEAVVAHLTPAGRQAAAGQPRNSIGQPEIPEG
jgi:hypothetical protein